VTYHIVNQQNEKDFLLLLLLLPKEEDSSEINDWKVLTGGKTAP
jgi:hypothetical protein